MCICVQHVFLPMKFLHAVTLTIIIHFMEFDHRPSARLGSKPFEVSFRRCPSGFPPAGEDHHLGVSCFRRGATLGSKLCCSYLFNYCFFVLSIYCFSFRCYKGNNTFHSFPLKCLQWWLQSMCCVSITKCI